MKVIKTRSFSTMQDLIDWLCFYKIQPQQILNWYRDGEETSVVYWMEFEES